MDWMRCWIASGDGFAPSTPEPMISAAVPLTCGTAIEVPS